MEMVATMSDKKTVIVVGATGDGKSTFCNVIAGKKHNDKEFPVSRLGKSMTQETIKKEVKWRGNDFDLNLIDTPGLSDSHKRDFPNITKMIEVLKELESVDAFVLVIHGDNVNQLSSYFRNMIVVFILCFGKEFLLQNTIVEVSNWHYDDAAERGRKINGMSEERAIRQINEEIDEIIKREDIIEGLNLPVSVMTIAESRINLIYT